MCRRVCVLVGGGYSSLSRRNVVVGMVASETGFDIELLNVRGWPRMRIKVRLKLLT